MLRLMTGLIREVVQVLEGVPGGLVGHRDVLRRLRNGTMLVDGFEQADAGAPQHRAEFGFQFEVGLQLAPGHGGIRLMVVI